VSDTGFAEFGDPLTAREYEMLARLGRHGSRELVALEMGITRHTVRTYVSAAYRKLGASGLVGCFAKLGWLHVPGDPEIQAYGDLERSRIVEMKLRHLRREVDALLEVVA